MIPARDGRPDGRLAGAVAHELNNALASLRGFLELARESVGAGAPAGAAFAEMQLAIERVAGMTTDLAALAVESGEVRSVSLTECVAGGVRGVAAPPRIQWDCDATIEVMAAPGAAHLALVTLARLASPQGATSQLVCHMAGSRTETWKCVACDTRIGESVWFTLALAPGRRGGPGRTGDLPSMADIRREALLQAAHVAGGHVAAIPERDTLSVTLSRT